MNFFGKEYVKDEVFPLTFTHLAFALTITIVTYFITEYFLRFRLFKWVYIATFIVLLVTDVKTGNKKDAAKDFFKLATS